MGRLVGEVVLTTDYLSSANARSVPGAFFDRDRDPKAWVVHDPTPKAATVALKLFPALVNNYPELANLRDSLASDVRPINNADLAGLDAAAPTVELQLASHGHDFYAYQNVDIGYATEVMKQHGSAYLAWEMGLGKTLASCALADALDCRRVLVVCPNSSKLAVWGPEIEKWLGWPTVVLRNTKSQREKDLAHYNQISQGNDPSVLVVHYESLSIIGGSAGTGWKSLPKWDLVIGDEIHRISNPKTKTAKALKKVPTTYKLALSGSVIQNHAEELFSQLQWLYPKLYRSKWRDWNDRYLDFVDGSWGKICVGVKQDQLPEMQKELGVFMLYRRKSDELDLPELTEQTLYVELSASQKRVYNELLNDSMANLPSGGTLKAMDGLSLLSRLRQVASGLSLVDDTDPIADSTKLDLAVDVIKDADEPCVVFTWYKASAKELANRLNAQGVDSYVVTGDTPPSLRAGFIQEFQSGQRQVFIGTLGTLAESITLHRASRAVFIDRSWNPSHNAQARDRIHRIGQGKNVLVQYIVAKGTVDEFRVTPVIEDKAALRRLVLNA